MACMLCSGCPAGQLRPLRTVSRLVRSTRSTLVPCCACIPPLAFALPAPLRGAACSPVALRAACAAMRTIQIYVPNAVVLRNHGCIPCQQECRSACRLGALPASSLLAPLPAAPQLCDCSLPPPRLRPHPHSMHFLAEKSCSSPALSTKWNSTPRPRTFVHAVNCLLAGGAGKTWVSVQRALQAGAAGCPCPASYATACMPGKTASRSRVHLTGGCATLAGPLGCRASSPCRNLHGSGGSRDKLMPSNQVGTAYNRTGVHPSPPLPWALRRARG